MSECSSSSECDSEISGAYKQLGLSAGATVAEVAVGFDQKLRQLADKDINNLCFNNLFTDPSKQLSQVSTPAPQTVLHALSVHNGC